MDARTGSDPKPTDTAMDDPLWYKDAIIYQLHIKSFFDSNNDGIGDFPGLLQKLDYIADLGVTAIWMLPFYPSPRRDDGYDIAEYRGVHPEYGSLGDFRRLVDAAHARGLKVITELVVNHTSDQHKWFQRARRAKPGSAARNFYVWSDDDQKYSGTRIIFVDTEKSNWSWDAEAGAYYWHRFYSHQPDLNFDNPRVLQEVLGVMRFWMDMGVDGMRLDAVPYLVEREGTNNENLPETHDVLKRIRAELDRVAPGRMLLAEANQWPEDAQVYFGEGDECHMSFHFPLMPRMYMAIAQEDRFPISDIMRQTPDIPENCQWAVFLRNHDELTLEMVTDAERDYLWEVYAADRRARINLGIRRRLAPLLEHDRRRIELMKGLLLSMPGTPVIYYGDELGMGDNVHLGDRDGVRTPMQWSPDRNGGFSRANPASLVLPAIMDPVYGYQAVNVEAQSADPHSLLNWTRRMLAVRRQYRAFGRGGFRFLYPGNRKILAYIREYKDEEGRDETILCVYNLARTAQAVELDLAEMEGRIPVDLIGGSAFPRIGQLSYLLTLPPYAFYWFNLATEATLPSWAVEHSQPLPEYATLVIRDGVGECVTGEARQRLERESLPDYLARRRWFGAKDRQIESVRIGRADVFKGRSAELVLADIVVDLGQNRQDTYQLPLIIAWDDAHPSALAAQLALARVRRHRRIGYLTDAFTDDALPFGVLRGLAEHRRIATEDGGEVRFLPTAAMGDLQIAEDAAIRRFSAEQSNSSMIIGEAAILKVLRRLEPGIHPEAEMTRFLTEAGFANTPPLLGEIRRTDPDGSSRTLIVVQGFVRNQGDAWQWTADALARALDAVMMPEATLEVEEDALAPAVSFVSAIGKRLGEMHAALAAAKDEPDFDPFVAGEAEVAAWSEGATAQIDAAFDALERAAASSDEETRATIDGLVRRRSRLVEAIGGLAVAGLGTLLTRVHGDFHLGQVIAAQGDAFIIDFEGEPLKPLAARRARSSPMRDVAGLMRSLDYAAAAAERAGVAPSERSIDRRQALLRHFVSESQAAFLGAYRQAAAEAPKPWLDERGNDRLLDLFLLEKAAYEVCYEAANRPDWLAIPLGGLAALTDRLAGVDDDAPTQ